MAATTITTGQVGTDAVAIAQLSATGTASSSTFLRGDNSWTAAGGAWTLIGTVAASASSSLTITGLTSTYDVYAIAFSDIRPATNAVNAWLRLGDSSGVDSGASDYKWQSLNTNGGSPTASADSAEDEIMLNGVSGINHGTATGEGFIGMYYLMTPSDATMYPSLIGYGGSFDGTNPFPTMITAQRLSVITCDRVEFLFSSGNVASGRMSVWGIAHA